MENIIHSWNEIIELVGRDKSINFTAKAVTPWNALSIDALIALLQEKGINVKAAIVIAEHYSAGYMIDPSFFTNNCAQYYYLPSDATKLEKESQSSSGKTSIKRRIADIIQFYRFVFLKQSTAEAPLYYSTFNHAIPDVAILSQFGNVKRKVVICHTEEGVGAYMGTFDKTYPEWKDVKTIGEFHDYLRNVFFGKIVYRALHKSYNSLTLKKVWGTLRVNKEIIPFYKDIFKRRNDAVLPSLDKSQIENSIIVCTTAWRRDEIVDNEDLKVLSKVCNVLWKRGYNLLLKTHPRDSFFLKQASMLHCNVLNVPGLSMECLCAYASPKAVISFSSTTLINPKIFWDIPTYCLTDMLNRTKISAFYLDEIDSFKRTFQSIVSYIHDADDILV